MKVNFEASINFPLAVGTVTTEAQLATKAKLLVVEDDALIRMPLADMLGEIGYTVAAGVGTDAENRL
jgi:hypothetical protein